MVRERLVLDEVTAAEWDAFHAGKADGLAPQLVDCWTRALALGAPAAGAPPEAAILRGDDLRIRTAQVELVHTLGDAVLGRATAQVDDRDFLLLLADPDGVVVHTSGGGGFAETAAQLRLIRGACWSEASRGTNAIGTAATVNRPTEVHGHAHFGRSYAGLVCYAAPVRGLDGQPVAVLDATSRLECADPAVARTVLRTARALEELIKLHAYATAGTSVSRVLGRSLDRIREPALMIEAPGTIVRANAAARELLRSDLVGKPPELALGIDWQGLIAEALSATPDGIPRVFGAGSTRRSARVRVEPVTTHNGAIIAMMVVLEPGRVAMTPHLPPAAHDPFAAIFSDDAAVTAAVRWCDQLAASELPVMLLAETGAGKELFARAIHAASARSAGPWFAINCGALAPALLETELFGYAPGAFTGAERTGRTGLFHAAAGGTLFLDEVAEMSPAMQAALLRVLETQTFRRVGDTRLERTDVRIVCATCRDLPALVASGAFRQDLYYRLKGATVRIPPLRERTDIRALAEHLLGAHGELSPQAADALTRFAWPGNVRELKSVLEVAHLASGGAMIEVRHLPPELEAPSMFEPEQSLDRIEREALVRALAEAGGNVSRAARALGVARSTLHRMKRRHQVH